MQNESIFSIPRFNISQDLEIKHNSHDFLSQYLINDFCLSGMIVVEHMPSIFHLLIPNM